MEDDWEETVKSTPAQDNPLEHRMGQGVERDSEEIDVEVNVHMTAEGFNEVIEEVNEESTNASRRSNREKRVPQRYGSWVPK